MDMNKPSFDTKAVFTCIVMNPGENISFKVALIRGEKELDATFLAVTALCDPHVTLSYPIVVIHYCV